jgi:site-specific recombinase XerD
MLDHFFPPLVVARLRASLFGPWLEAYVVRLKELRLIDKSIQRYVHTVEHFGCWLKRRHIDPTDIDHQTVRTFLQNHLPRCRCSHFVNARQFRANTLMNVRPALLHLLRLPAFADNAPPPPSSKADVVLAEYDLYLLQAAGLAAQTRRARRHWARLFLTEVAASRRDGSLKWDKLRPQDVATFFNRHVSNLRPRSIQQAASCVRSFLRFLRTTARCDRDLTGAVPSVPKWSLASIPRYLTEKQLRAFYRNFRRATPKGRRDYAMALCLAELGLRASEVVALRLDDIDWRAGTLRVVGGKNRRDRELPLPQAVGEAITVYLQKGRPKSAARHLFLRYGRFQGQAISTWIVRREMGRALKKVPGYEHLKGAHVLRHTAATRLFQHGVPLKVVADVLGHQSIDTTQIYTKVDVPSLAKVALPWPEVQP